MAAKRNQKKGKQPRQRVQEDYYWLNGEKVRELLEKQREKGRWTQEDVAKRFVVTRASVHKYVTGKNRCHKEVILRMAKWLDVSARSLIRSDELASWDRDRKRKKGRKIAVKEDEVFPDMTPKEQAVKKFLYYYPGGYVGSIQLCGFGGEFWTEHTVQIQYQHEALNLPAWYHTMKPSVIEEKERQARRGGTLFFNGPNTRLISWRMFIRDNETVALEKKILELVLGPVSWHEYQVLNGTVNETLLDVVGYRERDVDIYSLAQNQDVRYSHLSNLFCNAVTIVTRDGWIGYQFRSKKVSAVPDLFTSAVAENTNRFLDDADSCDSTLLVNKSDHLVSPADCQADHMYEPKQVPHPFAAVRRGIQEELSPDLLDYLPPNAIKLTGLSFGLDALLLPTAHYVVFIDIPKDKILSIRRNNPGRDRFEGDLRFMRPDFSDPETSKPLNQGAWVYGGKVSVIRTIQLLQTEMKRYGDFDTTFNFLANAD